MLIGKISFVLLLSVSFLCPAFGIDSASGDSDGPNNGAIEGQILLRANTVSETSKPVAAPKGIKGVAIYALSKDGSQKMTRGSRAASVEFGADGFTPRVLVSSGFDAVTIRNATDLPVHMSMRGIETFRAEIIQPKATYELLIEPDETWPILVQETVGHKECWIMVTPSLHATVTNKDGTFRIGQLPPGEWVFRVWHPNIRFTKVLKRERIVLGIKSSTIKLDPIIISDEDIVGRLEQP